MSTVEMVPPVASDSFGRYDFGLTEAQEQRAARLHTDSVIVDLLFQGPVGYRSFTDDMVAELQDAYAVHHDPARLFFHAVGVPLRLSLTGELPLQELWDATGVTAGTFETLLAPA